MALLEVKGQRDKRITEYFLTSSLKQVVFPISTEHILIIYSINICVYNIHK